MNGRGEYGHHVDPAESLAARRIRNAVDAGDQLLSAIHSRHDWRVGGAWRIVLKTLVAATLEQIADMRNREKLELQRIEVGTQAELPAFGRGLAFPSGDGGPVSSGDRMTDRPPAKRKSAGVHRKQRGRPPDEETSKKSPDQIIDEALDESFPASDPPSWSGPARIGPPLRKLGRR